jgi:hypothetical protein
MVVKAKRGFRAYTQTHTFTLRGCERVYELLSSRGEEEINKAFGNMLVKAGIKVRKNPKNKKRRVMSDMFGGKGGYTGAAILGSSAADIHTYPEEMYGKTVEVEVNVCSLNGDAMELHIRTMMELMFRLVTTFRPKETIYRVSDKRYLEPLEY